MSVQVAGGSVYYTTSVSVSSCEPECVQRSDAGPNKVSTAQTLEVTKPMNGLSARRCPFTRISSIKERTVRHRNGAVVVASSKHEQLTTNPNAMRGRPLRKSQQTSNFSPKRKGYTWTTLPTSALRPNRQWESVELAPHIPFSLIHRHAPYLKKYSASTVPTFHQTVSFQNTTEDNPSCPVGPLACKDVQPFQLLSPAHPVPQLPSVLEDALMSYYLLMLRQLPTGEQERVVTAVAAERDGKHVMVYLRRQERHSDIAQAGGTSLAYDTEVNSDLDGHRHATQTVFRRAVRNPVSENRMYRVPSSGTSRRRAINSYSSLEEKEVIQKECYRVAVERFRERFTIEACAAFLEDVVAACKDRLERYYRHQPAVAKKHGILVTEEEITPYFVEIIGSLLYCMIGWTQEEAVKYSKAVIAAVLWRIPKVVLSPSPSA